MSEPTKLDPSRSSAAGPLVPPALADDDPRALEAFFRYGVIGELVAAVLERGETSALVREAARRRWRAPSGEEVRVAERTIWDWLCTWRSGGLAALLPRCRKDAGVARALSAEALDFAQALRVEDRARSAADVLDALVRKGLVPEGSASRQSVDRALRRAGLERIRPGAKPQKVRRRIEVAAPNALWVGDYHDPLAIPLASGGVLRCHNAAWIDHKSRWVPYSAYYPSQAIYTLEDCFKKALLKGGRPDRVYVDNAKIYRSGAFAFACDRVGTALVHSKAYESECRGAIERFWGDGDVGSFERELVRRGARDLRDVNALYWAWLEERYHRRPHEEIGATPLDARAGFEPVFPPLDLLAELFLIKVTRTVDRKFSTVRIDDVAFHVDPRLRKKLVAVHYDPHDLTSVVIYYDGRRVERAERALPNTAPPTPPEPASVPSGFDYLGQILIDHERRRAAQAHPIAFAALEGGAATARFEASDFERHLELAAGRPLKAAERVEARALFERYGPIDERVVALALDRAVAARGRGLHVSVYLDFVRTFHVERGGTKKS